jgi:TIR domain
VRSENSSAPLQVFVFRQPADLDTLPYEEAVVRAFQGGQDSDGYLATGDDLGIQLQIFSGAPELPVAEALDSFAHSFVLVLADLAFGSTDDNALWDWLAACWETVRASSGRHEMLVIAMDERVGDRFIAQRPALDSLQLLQSYELGERAIRATTLALRVLHECRVLLARGLAGPATPEPGFLRLFISHAKMDGLPLAHALKHEIESMPWLSKFYDIEDLPPGSDWKVELENGVGSSIIIMLRTEAYDGRYWCQQEVLWADEYATPAVLVDARTRLNHPGGGLPFDRVPTVRIPDGNLIRILFVSLREGLRFLHFMRRVEQIKERGGIPVSASIRVFSTQPSMAALLRACRSLSAASANNSDRLIIYPDPTLRVGLFEAATALVSLYSPGTRLVTPNTLAATAGNS